MSYVVNETRMSRVTVDGVDVTDAVTSLTLSDSSGIKQGLIATDGELILNYRNGATPLEDYKRNLYQRGTPVTVHVTFPSGNEVRHPRGTLFILDTLFDPQAETIKLNVGCKMALNALLEDVEDLIDLVELYMPSTRRTYSGISAALATMGEIAWYDGQGVLRVERLWSGESQTGSPPAAYVSVFGVTALEVAPLNASPSYEVKGKASNTGIKYPYQDPDNIVLEYEYGACLYDADGSESACIEDPDDDGSTPATEEVAEAESVYFAQYPAIFYERVPPGEEDDLDEAGDPDDEEGNTEGNESQCVDEPLESENPASGDTGGGEDNGQTTCMDNYQTARTPLLVGVRSKSTTTTSYLGPGNARNHVVTETYGPAMEANGQYIGDNYQLCRQSWANRCNPNGYCSTDLGTQMVQLGRDETRVEFNEDGSVLREIKDSYST